jgi:hypothetical protein
MIDIFHSSVSSYDSETGQYYIRLSGSSFNTLPGTPAYLLAPTPHGDGSGIKSAPVAPIDSQCLVFKNGNRHYILGFVSPHGVVVHGDVKPVRPIKEGEVFITHSTPSKMGITAQGTILHEAGKWASVAINPITQQLTSWFRNFRMNFFTAIVQYFADTNKKAATASIKLAKWIIPTGQPTPPPDGSPTTIPDHLTLKAGVLDDSHIIELNVNQNYVGSTPNYLSSTFIGVQKNGTFLEHDVSNKGSDGKTTDMYVRAKADGSITTHIGRSSNYVNTSMDTSDDSTKPGLLLDVNGKTQITISKSGDVTITTADKATIKLGGTGNEQALATQAFIEKIFKLHTHSNGNAGGATGPPLTPTIPAVTKDDKNNSYTFTTKAE